jgi:hypothetical protein
LWHHPEQSNGRQQTQLREMKRSIRSKSRVKKCCRMTCAVNLIYTYTIIYNVGPWRYRSWFVTPLARVCGRYIMIYQIYHDISIVTLVYKPT